MAEVLPAVIVPLVDELLPVVVADVEPLVPTIELEISIKATVFPEALEETKLPASGPFAAVPEEDGLVAGAAADGPLPVAFELTLLLGLAALPVEVALVPALPALAPWKAPDQFMPLSTD